MTTTEHSQPALITCREASRALYDFLDRRLPGDSTASVQQHIDTCRECASHYEFARQVLALVPQSVPLDDDCSALQARILSALSAEGFSRA